MCIYCSTYPYPYSPYQYSGMSYGNPYGYGGLGSYGGYGSYGYPYYGLPLGYSYAYPSPAPFLPRGEHRVGNCLCIC